MEKKTVKAWAIVGKKNGDFWTAFEKRDTARREKREHSLFHGHDKVVPCTITYEIPTPKEKNI